MENNEMVEEIANVTPTFEACGVKHTLIMKWHAVSYNLFLCEVLKTSSIFLQYIP